MVALDDTIRELSTHEGVDGLAARVRDAAFAAFDARNPQFGSPTGAEAEEPEDAQTPLGNVAAVLTRGALDDGERRLLSSLLTLSVARSFPASVEEQHRLAAAVVWLAAHTSCDALAGADVALADDADPFWAAVAHVAGHPESVGLGRVEALVAAGALATSSSEPARFALASLEAAADGAIRRLARADGEPGGAPSHPARLDGELSPTPRGPVATVLLALTGVLLFAHLGRLVGRLALGYRRPATIEVTERGIELGYRTLLLGRVLRERELVVPLDNLARVTREIRFARLGLYAGLIALVLGTYFGMGLLVDGSRVPGGSPSLLAMGAAVIIVGLLIDFGLSSLSDSARGRCRLVVEPRKGRALCVAQLDPKSADSMLVAIARREPGR